MQAIFAWYCGKTVIESENSKQIIDSLSDLDQIISQNAPKWPIDKINNVDLSILRCAIWELLNQETPARVVIDEAVELAKEFGTETSSSFVNGVLGSITKTNPIISEKIITQKDNGSPKN